MAPRWHKAIFLGKWTRTGEHVAYCPATDSIVRGRSVRVLPEAVTVDQLRQIKKRPEEGDPEPQARQDRRPADQGQERCILLEPQDWKPRDFKITREILTHTGYTPTCAKCRDIRAGSRLNVNTAHTRECRERVRAAMENNAGLKHHLEAARERKTAG